MSRAKPRLLVLVLNEATLDLIEPWAAAGILPEFRTMLAEGLCGRPLSRWPLLGPERWGNLVTGQNADRHGLTEFLQRDPVGDFGPIRFGRRFGLQAEPIWRLLSRSGVRCGVVNAPLAYPEDVPGGFVVQEMLDAFAWRLAEDPDWRRRMSGPVELYDEIQRRFGPGRIMVHDLDKSELVPLLTEQVERQIRVLSWLLKERDWDFCLTRLTQAADAQHYLWLDQLSGDPASPHRDGIQRVYRAVDRGLAELRAAAGPEATLLIVSDCGAGPLRAGIQLNTWLANEGFLRFDQAAATRSEAQGTMLAAPQANGGLRGMLRRALPGPLYRAAARLKHRLRPAPRQVGNDGLINWRETRAFAVGVEGGISINLRGREPGGIVEPGDEYRSVCEQISARLGRLIDPDTGEGIIARVQKASDLYGPAVAARAPDLFVEWRGGEYLPTEIEAEPGAVFAPHRQHGKILPTTGGHRVDGILLATGPGIEPGRLSQASVFDVMPTCLHLLEQPLPPGLRGRSLV